MHVAKHFVLASIVFLLCSCSTKKTSLPRTETVIGTVCSVNAFEDGTEQLYDAIFKRLRQIDALFNVNRTDSMISHVNAAAGKSSVAVNSDFIFVLNKALHYARLTDGVFDPTIGPLVKLWGINTEHAKVPSAQEISHVLEYVDWKKVIVDESSEKPTVFLAKEGMSLDLGGIAKGFASDEITAILEKNRVKRAIIDLGGNVCVFGKKKNGSAWNIGIKNPFDPDSTPVLVLGMTHGGTVVTSGIYERYFEKDGVRYHHIFDVQNGMPAVRDWSSVTIVAPQDKSVDADALSTIAFLVGLERYSSITDIPAVFIDNDGEIRQSENLSRTATLRPALPVGTK